MDIKNKFPELIHFIENPKSYELLYYREDTIHNEYALDSIEAKKIINYILDLKKENKELTKIIENIRCSFLKYDWETSTSKQVYSQLKKLYESIFVKFDVENKELKEHEQK